MASARELGSLLCAQLGGHELSALCDDPIAAIPLVASGVSIDLVDSAPEGNCSVEGIYYEDSGRIVVHRAASERRTRFTALHEFGHHLARRHLDVARVLATMRPGPSRRFEEQIADAVAAAILIPEEAVDEVLDGRSPTASHAAVLFHHERVGGSREACCVRLAQRMSGNGYVVLAEGDVLRFCAVVGTAYRVGRGSTQPADSILVRAGEAGRPMTADEVTLRHRSGAETPPYAAHAVPDGAYVFGVLTDATRPPWGGWRPPSKSRLAPPEIDCPECEETVEAWERCDAGPHRICGLCGWCECKAIRAKVPTRVCEECWLHKPASIFEPGSSICRDCSSA